MMQKWVLHSRHQPVSRKRLINLEPDYFTDDEEEPYADEKAHMFARIVRNVELSNALEKYFELSDKKRKHVLELIDLLSEK